jgi:hypothetical protein
MKQDELEKGVSKYWDAYDQYADEGFSNPDELAEGDLESEYTPKEIEQIVEEAWK